MNTKIQRSADNVPAPSVAILVATFRRPAGLAELLTSLAKDVEQWPGKIDVVVVDNDAEASARSVAAAYPCIYVVEPTPGIAPARNRALEEAGDAYDLLAFVDDDERVMPGWLAAHVETLGATGADASFGPVVAKFQDGCPRWVRTLGFFDRPRGITGGPVRWPATNNVIMRRSALDRLAVPRFSQEFSTTGGSDSDFFDRLTEAGAVLCWCDEAIVEEVNPLERANFRWLWRRGKRLGNVSTRMLSRHGSSRARITSVALLRVVAAVPLAFIHAVTGRAPGPALMNIPKGVGMLGAQRGELVQEYARATPNKG